MRYLWGIDGSLSCTGITIFDIDTLQHVHTTSIKTKKEDKNARFDYLRVQTTELIKMYPPSEVVFEDSFVRNNDPTKQIQRALGAMFCALKDFEPIFYAPNSIKKTVAGHGKATKAAVKQNILLRHKNVKFKNYDESDSYAVCVKHLCEQYNYKWNLGDFI